MRATLFVLIVAFWCASGALAQSGTKPANAAETLPPIFAPRPSPKDAVAGRGSVPSRPPPTRRAISPEMAEKISALATRAAPPASSNAATVTTPGIPSPDGTGSSDVVQLAPFVVKEDKLPDIKERQLLTPKGKLELAKKLNPGLNLGPLSSMNNGVALEMAEEVFAQERRKELAELKSVLNAGETKPPPELRRKIDEAMTRKNEWSHEIGTPFRPPR